MFIVGINQTTIDFITQYGVIDTNDETTAIETWVNYYLANNTSVYDSFLDSCWNIVFLRYTSTPTSPPTFNLDLIVSLFPTYSLQFQTDLYNTMVYQLKLASGAIVGDIYTYLNGQTITFKTQIIDYVYPQGLFYSPITLVS